MSSNENPQQEGRTRLPSIRSILSVGPNESASTLYVPSAGPSGQVGQHSQADLSVYWAPADTGTTVVPSSLRAETVVTGAFSRNIPSTQGKIGMQQGTQSYTI
jgi:hypothetical protein